jgi:hypothetical protein
MEKLHHAPQVGAPDPERHNSPIIDRQESEEPTLDYEMESDACYFNDQRYEIGEYVRSGDELLHCAEHGIWLKLAEERPA